MTARRDTLDIVDVSLVAGEIVGALEPVDGAGQPLVQRHARTKPSHGENLAVVAPQALDLAALGADARVVGDDLGVAAEDVLDHRHGVADRDLAVGADIDGLADGGVAAGERQEAAAGVLDIVEVAGWRGEGW